jgi:hypothetical protein
MKKGRQEPAILPLPIITRRYTPSERGIISRLKIKKKFPLSRQNNSL